MNPYENKYAERRRRYEPPCGGLLTPEQDAELRKKLEAAWQKSPLLHHCLMLYSMGELTWEQALMQAAVSLQEHNDKLMFMMAEIDLRRPVTIHINQKGGMRHDA